MLQRLWGSLIDAVPGARVVVAYSHGLIPFWLFVALMALAISREDPRRPEVRRRAANIRRLREERELEAFDWPV